MYRDRDLKYFPYSDFLIKVFSREAEFQIYLEEEIPWQS